MKVVTQSETKYGISLYVTKPSMRYIDEMIQSACFSDLLAWELFPNTKEITESCAAYAAVRRHLWRYNYRPGDKDIRLIAVGDGSTPRTAAMFACRTAWDCHSVDPNLRTQTSRWSPIQRLTMHRKRIEEMNFKDDRPTIIVAVHSHAKLPESVQAVHSSRMALVAIPCCVPLELPRDPDTIYSDYGILSPERTVKVWLKV